MLNRLRDIKTSTTSDWSINSSKQKNLHISTKAIRFIVLPLIAIVAFTTTIVIIATHQPVISEDYFISDETKTSIVLTPSNNDGTGLVQTFLVYTYDGEKVSGLKTYFEYPDAETAKTVLETIKNQPEFKGAVVNDKYIVVTADKSQYEGLTASDVTQQAEALKIYQDSQTIQLDSTNSSSETDPKEE